MKLYISALTKHCKLISMVSAVVLLLWLYGVSKVKQVDTQQITESASGLTSKEVDRQQIAESASELALIPRSGIVTTDPLKDTNIHSFSGSITYAFGFGLDETSKGEESSTGYLVVRPVDSKTTEGTNDDKRQAMTYVAPNRTLYTTLFDPEFTPTGFYVLFKVGDPGSSMGSYHAYVLDTHTHKVTQAIPDSLTYRKILWSPDEQYLAYIAGSDIEGNSGGGGCQKDCVNGR